MAHSGGVRLWGTRVSPAPPARFDVLVSPERGNRRADDEYTPRDLAFLVARTGALSPQRQSRAAFGANHAQSEETKTRGAAN